MQKEKFKKKVKGILQISDHVENLDVETMAVYQVTSSYLQQFLIPESRAYKISTAVMETNIIDFYTTHLVPVSTLQCGSLLKNWDDIPGRDISPERYTVPLWDDTLLTLETQNEGSSFDATETKREETENSTKSLLVVNDLKSNYNSKTESDNLKLPNTDVTAHAKFQEDTPSKKSDESDVVDKMDAQIEEKRVFEQSPDESDVADFMDVDIVAQIGVRSAREQSPDMFAEYDSSANNSFNDGKILFCFISIKSLAE